MPTTVQDLVNQALLDLGEIQPGETPNTAESNAIFPVLNRILSSWSLEGIKNYQQAITSFTLTANVEAYTMGNGGTWNTSTAGRPVKIKGARVLYQGLEQGVMVMPIGAFEQSLDHNAKTAAIEYLANGQPVSTVLAAWASGNMPTKLGEDSGAPFKNVRIWPVPTTSATIEVSYFVALTAFNALSDTVNFPVPGYEAALVAELAVAIAPSYGNPPAVQGIIANMNRYTQRIIEINGQIEIGQLQPATSANQ